jgi:TonB family protein
MYHPYNDWKKFFFSTIGLFISFIASTNAEETRFICSTDDFVQAEPFRFPPDSLSGKGSDTVIIKTNIREDGTFEDVKIHQSSFDRNFDRSAIDYVEKSRLTGACFHTGIGKLHITFAVGHDTINANSRFITELWREPEKESPEAEIRFICKHDDLVEVTPFRFPPHTAQPRQPTKVVIVKVDVHEDGTYENVGIDQSSRNRDLDRAFRAYIQQTRITGECLHAAAGSLYVMLAAGWDLTDVDPLVAADSIGLIKIWRESKREDQDAENR